jgi:phosphoserine phosphatase
MTRLALFDVDGTLTRRDTMFLFLRHTLGTVGALWAVTKVAPLLALHVVGVVDNTRAKQALLRSEERRVGKECRRLCRSRWSPYH